MILLISESGTLRYLFKSYLVRQETLINLFRRIGTHIISAQSLNLGLIKLRKSKDN
jgi:hypothetical protein